MRLIDADALNTEVELLPYYRCTTGYRRILGAGLNKKVAFDARNTLVLYSDIRNLIYNAPDIEDEPVRRGWWEWFEDWGVGRPSADPAEPEECLEAGWRCSECKVDLAKYLTENLQEVVYLDRPDEKPTLARCPNCGSLMDMEDEDHDA